MRSKAHGIVADPANTWVIEASKYFADFHGPVVDFLHTQKNLLNITKVMIIVIVIFPMLHILQQYYDIFSPKS